MRLAHKRRVQQKLKKIQVVRQTEKATKPVKATKLEAAAKPVKAAPVAEAVVEKPAVNNDVPATTPAASVALTPKQRQILDIVSAAKEAMSPKTIGLEAGQEDAKAAAWATGGLKKLLELELVEKIAIGSNKFAYQAK